MFTYIMDDRLIDLLLTTAIGCPAFHENDMTIKPEIPAHVACNETGQMLIDENCRSLTNYGYEHIYPHKYVYTCYTGDESPGYIIKVCNHYDFLASRSDDYLLTPAAKLVHNIRMRAAERIK